MDWSGGGGTFDTPEYTAGGRMRRRRGQNLMGTRFGTLDDYKIKTFPKSPLQKQLLLDALRGNFVFKKMGDQEMDVLADAMERRVVNRDELLITQGEF